MKFKDVPLPTETLQFLQAWSPSNTSEGNFYSMNNYHENINEPGLFNYKGVQVALFKNV